MSVTTGLYDSPRQLDHVKPRWRGRFHLVWFAVSLAAGPWLVFSTGGDTARTAMAVYAVG